MNHKTLMMVIFVFTILIAITGGYYSGSYNAYDEGYDTGYNVGYAVGETNGAYNGFKFAYETIYEKQNEGYTLLKSEDEFWNIIDQNNLKAPIVSYIGSYYHPASYYSGQFTNGTYFGCYSEGYTSSDFGDKILYFYKTYTEEPSLNIIYR